MGKSVVTCFLKLAVLFMIIFCVNAQAADAAPGNAAYVCPVPPTGWECAGTSIGCACFKTTEPTKCSCPPGWVHTARAVTSSEARAIASSNGGLLYCACSEAITHSSRGSATGAPAAAPATAIQGSRLVMMPSTHANTSVNVQILSATIKDQKIGDATITLQKNGEQSVTGTSNAQGQVSLNASFADDPTALLIIKKSGYSNLVVKCPCAGMTYAISPVMANLDGMRIVLNWGSDPRDLDSHLQFPNNHVYFMQKNGADTLLDVDAQNGYGPETITINRKHDGERYVYAVHDYINRMNINSDRLSNSGAKVFVYVGQTLIRTYYVPVNKKGNLWSVFEVSGTGEFQDINAISGVLTGNDSRLGAAELQGVTSQFTVPLISYSANNQERAKAINKQGEDAYHAGNLDESIRLYQEAIEYDGNFGQAYSNLGLSFQKAGRVAEAMWANRKAIALANGPTAATVRASSHFNNGKIYEAASQWSDALREYQYAKNEKANPAYDKGIQRMQQKGGQ